MPRKATRQVTLMDDDDDDAMSEPGKAADSDILELEAYAKAVAEFKVTWQRQKRQKERKFLKAAQAELDEHVNRKKGEIHQMVNDMEEAYQEFLLKYAALEDRKREVLVKIIDVQKTLVALSVRKHQETVQLTLEREDAKLEGMKQIRQTCHDFAAMVDAFMEV